MHDTNSSSLQITDRQEQDDYEEDFDATAENSYIIDKGNVYDLYFNGHYVGEIYEIPDEFKDYPVYKEKPGDGE